MNRPAAALLPCALALLLSTACTTNSTNDSTESESSSTTTDNESGSETNGECQSPLLQLTNNTGNTIEVLHFLACDMSDGNDYPLPPPGLANGDSTNIPFPGPGCWLIGYEGEGCASDMPVTTPELACGEVYSWMPDDLNHVCQG